MIDQRFEKCPKKEATHFHWLTNQYAFEPEGAVIGSMPEDSFLLELPKAYRKRKKYAVYHIQDLSKYKKKWGEITYLKLKEEETEKVELTLPEVRLVLSYLNSTNSWYYGQEERFYKRKKRVIKKLDNLFKGEE